MKNIHLIPTEKPSKLFIHNAFNDLRFDIRELKHDNNQNIYITNDDKIKEGDWIILDNSIKELPEYQGLHVIQIVDNTSLKSAIALNCKKIILTTDPQLIENGVQEIDDEFLEWFVNNPSCEFVKTYWNPLNSEYDFMIPKEEPQQEFHICKYCGVETTQPDDECYAKQKTVEEIAKTKAFEFKIDYKPFETDLDYREYAEYGFEKGFIDGTKCQSERMYSGEEVIAIVEKSRETGLTAEYLLLTEQFKKDKL
jgi:hypothetical protein